MPGATPVWTASFRLLLRLAGHPFTVPDFIWELRLHFPPLLGPRPLAPVALTRVPKTFVIAGSSVSCLAQLYVHPHHLTFALYLAPCLAVDSSNVLKTFWG